MAMCYMIRLCNILHTNYGDSMHSQYHLINDTTNVILHSLKKRPISRFPPARIIHLQRYAMCRSKKLVCLLVR